MVYTQSPRDLALLLNPEGGRNQREWPWVLALAQQMGMQTCLASTPQEIEACVLKLADQGKTLLVSGGDGTVSLVLGALQRLPPSQRPLLSLLPGGTTNLIAQDLSPLSQIQILHALRKRPAKLVKRAVMRLDPPGAWGMFVGGGLILEGVKLFRQKRSRARGRPFPWPKVLLALGRQIFLAQSKCPVQALENGLLSHPGPFWLFLATSLFKLFGKLSPFLPCQPEELRVCALSASSKDLLRFLPALFLQQASPHQPQKGFYSLCSRKLVIYTQELALDGEIHTSPEGRFVLSSAGEVIFLTW